MASYSYKVFDVITFTNSVSPTETPAPNRLTVTTTITVGSATTFEKDREYNDAHSVTQTIVIALGSARTISQSLTFTEVVNFYLTKAGVSAGYVSTEWIDPHVTLISAAWTEQATVAFSGVGTLTLRLPEWGDKDSYDVVRIQENTRGGDLIVYQDSMWPTTEILEITFKHLDATAAENVKTFLVNNLGKIVTFVDHLNRHWSGFFLTPDAEINQEKRFEYTVQLKFQGTLTS